MNRVHTRTACLLTTVALVASLMAGTMHAQTATQKPPVIDESVPPPFNDYPVGPDSLRHASVPAGKTFSFELRKSTIFPGTVHTITVYVPAQYKANRPACLYVGLDKLDFHAPIVFDNLIAQHAMPVTIGVGIASGTVPSAASPANPRFDRSYEFDSLTDQLARFILSEVLPAVEQHRTPDGLPILISGNPNDRAIGGASTGGIGAFNVAWQRPDAFHRVFTAIGTFVGMRGGERLYVLVRKTEPRPIRVFMEDGVHDEWPGGPEMGDWWMSNLTMQRALQFAGYDVRHIWGAGTHSGDHADSIFPDAMRWLWQGWPAPIESRPPGNPVLQQILLPRQGWSVAVTGCSSIPALVANAEGEVFYARATDAGLVAVSSSGKPGSCETAAARAAFAFGANGKLYTAQPRGGIRISPSPSGSHRGRLIAAGLRVQAFTLRHNGEVYALTQGSGDRNDLWLIPPEGKPVRLDSGLRDGSAVALTPDELWLFVAQRASHTGISYRVQPDGTVDSRAPFYDFYVPASADNSGAGAIAMDRDGRAWVATRMGVQVFDRNGRVTAILPLPGGMPASSLCFGGARFDTLYVSAGGKIYQRKLQVTGALPGQQPIQLPPGSAG